MQIDWFTVVAQIINFLILVFLLKKFLYKPISDAIEERRKRIEQREEDAQKRTDEAENKKKKYNQEIENIENRKKEIIDQARKEAESVGKELMEHAKKEYEESRDEWKQTLLSEKESFAASLRREISKKVCNIARNALESIANAQLENMVFDVFISKLQDDLAISQVEKLKEALANGKSKINVNSAFILSQESKNRLEKILHQYIQGELELVYKRHEELICGIELEIKDYRISWSIHDYMDNFQEQLINEIEADGFILEKGVV